jgi:ABC-type Zn uptake system ZnuABC Zn-binding protein ZnuA
MRTTAIAILLLAVVTGGPSAVAGEEKLEVVTTLPDYAWLAERIGGDRVRVRHIVRGDQDAHFIRPKPSFITMVQEADLLVATGLDLELWLPTVVDRSGNRAVRSGMDGYVAASQGMTLLEKPGTLSRIEGGLHIHGNPHVTSSPIQIAVAARNIATGLARNDPEGRELFMRNFEKIRDDLDRRLYGERLVSLLGRETLTKLAKTDKLVPFVTKHSYRGKKLSEYAGGWLGKMLPLAGTPIVTYHKNWVYFLTIFGIEDAGTVEPKPGIPPSPKHVSDLIETMRKRRIGIMLAANYFDEHKVRTIAERVGAVPVIVPMYVGGAPGTETYPKLFDRWVESLVAASAKAAERR